MVSDVELCWLFRFAEEVASGNPNPNEAKLLCCTRLRYLFIKIRKKKVSVCVQQQFSDALSRWTIFGVRNCFATHIHVCYRIAIEKYAFGCSMLVQPVSSNKVSYFLLWCCCYAGVHRLARWHCRRKNEGCWTNKVKMNFCFCPFSIQFRCRLRIHSLIHFRCFLSNRIKYDCLLFFRRHLMLRVPLSLSVYVCNRRTALHRHKIFSFSLRQIE